MAFMNYVRDFFEQFHTPAPVERVLSEFTIARDRLRALVNHHDTKADLIDEKINDLRAAQYLHDQRANEAETFLDKFERFFGVD